MLFPVKQTNKQFQVPVLKGLFCQQQQQQQQQSIQGIYVMQTLRTHNGLTHWAPLSDINNLPEVRSKPSVYF